MAITIGLRGGARITVDRESATIGRGPGVDVVVDSPNVQPIHAKICKVAGRWMIESAGDWLLQIGDGVAGRKHWLQPNQTIYLAESGVSVVFEPPEPAAPIRAPSPGAATNAGASSQRSTDDAMADTAIPFLIPVRPPLDPQPLSENAASPHDKQHRLVELLDAEMESRSARPSPNATSIEFCGKGTVMIGMGTITITAKRACGADTPKQSTLVVDYTDVRKVLVDGSRVQILFKRSVGMAPLIFDAANVAEARTIAVTLEPDDLEEMRRMRSDASRRSRGIDSVAPRIFSVVF
jgi:hypothetical protein